MAISKKELARQRQIEEERQVKEKTRAEKDKAIHDQKVSTSAQMF